MTTITKSYTPAFKAQIVQELLKGVQDSEAMRCMFDLVLMAAQFLHGLVALYQSGLTLSFVRINPFPHTLFAQKWSCVITR